MEEYIVCFTVRNEKRTAVYIISSLRLLVGIVLSQSNFLPYLSYNNCVDNFRAFSLSCSSKYDIVASEFTWHFNRSH